MGSSHLKNRKGTEKKRVPFVISFSDDDSDSDSEENIRGNAVETDKAGKEVMENRKLSQKANIKMHKNVSTSRTIPSTNRVNGFFSKNGDKSNHPSKTKVAPNVHINGSKLQDLRQLIAIRENELKSKSNKEVVTTALKSSTNMNSNINAVRNRDSAGLEPMEPEKKRLKVSEPPTNSLITIGQHEKPPSESTSGPKISENETDSLKGKNDGRDTDVIGVTGQSSAMQQIKEAKNSNIPSMHPPSGSGIIRNNRRPNMNTTLAEASAPLAGITDIISPNTQVSLNNSNIWNHFGAANSDMDIESLLEIEELQDKELNEAQEYRRKCEIEERKALKAYRKAQRDLAEANSKCSYLYRKRELFSANLGSRLMDESTMLWPNMSHQHNGAANMNPVTNISENNMMPHHQVRNEFHINVRSPDDLREDGKDLDSESCSEPDTCGSEPQEDEILNDVNNDLIAPEPDTILAEDEQTSEFELTGGNSSHMEGISGGEKAEEVNDDLITPEEVNNDLITPEEVNNDEITPDPTEDSLLLEATLRSQLFARLANRTSKKNETEQNMQPATVDREDEEIMADREVVPPDTDKDQLYDFREPTCDEVPVKKVSLNEPVLRTAFGHVKFLAAMNSMQSQTNSNFNEKKVYNVSGAQRNDSIANSKTLSLLDMYVSDVGSYSNNVAVNPFWSLCMFELRGKCNDDECPMQHVRDYSSKSNDCNRNVSKCLGCPVTPPTYLVSLDSLKCDSHAYKYLVAQSFEQRWQKYFSGSLVVSSSVFADLHSDEPCLHGPETRIEVHGGWNRQSSYFHGKNVKEDQPEQHMDDTYHPLEIAFHNLTREVNKQKGRREALIVLARALEEHPKSVLLWIVYLHIYYSNQKSIGEDDMFYYAVEYNDSSYELWLMFINSREKLDDRLLAYNTALSALCRHASDPNTNPELNSECILDIYLQMLNFLCSCGQVNNAIQNAYTLFSFTKTSNDPNPPFLPDLHACLTIPDKRVLSVCCIYLILYKKLPDTIVHQFECQKELSAIEWHSVNLTPDEKTKAITLIELVGEYFDAKSDQKNVELFALNHIKCTAVVEGFDSCKNLLRKYIQLFPSCLELVLLSIRVNGFDSTMSTRAAFEEVLANWVEKSGIQCIWNQYAQLFIENGRVDFAKTVMERWFTSVSDVYRSGTKIVNISAWISSLAQTDIVFGLLNLALLKQLQNDHTEARIAIEQVMEIASSTDYNHCVKEHVMFSLKSGFGNGLEKAHLDVFLNKLTRYLMDPRASAPPEPLSRSFIRKISNPKTQKLVNNLLCPVSSDSSLLNLVLESCFGHMLLPFQGYETLTDVVDLAEALMELRPANYQLAISICKNLSDANASVSFWAGVQLIDSLFQAVPVAPEFLWVEAASLLQNVVGFKSMLESFHKKALSVYPFSLMLWKSYIGLDADNTEKTNVVTEMAREKGMKL
ncbi:uncharacterized protein [Rutidosis leptorrhynchoides]|uniref:uncharacterized protein n=1 Tax=Rutidosis leptorrhynchoides TaxID=125765 RepID=UPI003A9A4050